MEKDKKVVQRWNQKDLSLLLAKIEGTMQQELLTVLDSFEVGKVTNKIYKRCENTIEPQ